MYKRNFILPIIGVALAIVMIVMVPTSSYQLSNGVSNPPHPNEVTDWLKTHPDSFACVHTNIQTGVSSQVSCKHPEAQVHGDPPR